MKNKKKLFFLFLAVFAVLYGFGCFYFSNRFLPNTSIGDYDVSCKGIERAKQEMEKDAFDHYYLVIKNKEETESLSAEEVQLDFSLVLPEKQSVFAWPLSLVQSDAYDLNFSVSVQNPDAIHNLNCFLEPATPADAYISDYITDMGYTIIPEREGLNTERAETVILTALEHLESNTDLEKEHCYDAPEIVKENLKKEQEQLQQSILAVITYELGDQEVVLDPNRYHDWLTVTEEGVSVDREKAKEFLEELRYYDTSGKTRTLVSSTDGRTVSVSGPYGFRVSDQEVDQMIFDIQNGEVITRKPVYDREGVSYGDSDYGDTYVEIDLTNQKVYLYVEGEKIAESDCVTGNVKAGHTTPPGIYPITYKQKGATLRGQGYASYVNFWMPFNQGIGLHDASWRSTFGGSIYKTNGSHGCVNLPYDMAKTIFSYAYANMPVICYN